MERTIRYIMTVFGDINYIVSHSGYEVAEALRKEGYEVEKAPFYMYVLKDGLRFRLCYYSSNCSWNLEYGFYVGWIDTPWFHMRDIHKRGAEIPIDLVNVPEEFPAERTKETIGMIQRIKDSILETKRIVAAKGGWGELGGWLRSRGYRVTYDGGSVCNFLKDGVVYCAHTADRPGWYLEDYFNAYFPDNTLSDQFSLETDKHHLRLEESFEALFGDRLTSLGRYMTELEQVRAGMIKYDSYRVRKYSSKYLTTLKTFDTFEEAKKFAYEEAKRLAASTPPDLRRYARMNPTDCGDTYDYLAMYVYYQYDRSMHFLFVQGD